MTDPAPSQATLVATLTAAPSASELAELAAGADWIELRADLAPELDLADLRRRLPGKLFLLTLRSRAEGGAFDGAPERRRRRLLAAVPGFDLVDLEAERDLVPELLAAVPAERRIVSWHGPAASPAALAGRFARMAAQPARLYKLVPGAAHGGEELSPLLFLQGLRRRDVAAFASGAAGAWTRLVAPRLGCPVVYGAASGEPGAAGAPGQIPLARLREDYGLPDLPPVAALFGIVGNPVAHSLSPRLHNGAYRALGIPALYLPFHTAAFGDFWLEVVESGILELLGLPLKGLSVTSPFKAAALAVAGAESPRAGRIGAANTLVCRDGVWEAESTDPEGVVLPLRERGIEPAGRRAAVVGTGGAGRSAALGLAQAGAEVTLVNRGTERGQRAAADLRMPFLPLAGFDPAVFDVLVNATDLGRRPDDPLPFATGTLRPGAVVVDLVYDADRAEPTRLLAAAAAGGAICVGGREVLLSQARGQFRMMTGREMPVELARRLLGIPAVPQRTDSPRRGGSPGPGGSR